MNPEPNRRVPLAIAAAVSAVALAGGGVALLTTQQSPRSSLSEGPTPTVASPSPSSVAPTPVTPANTQSVPIYWLKANADRIAVVPKPVPISAADKQLDTSIKLAMTELLAKPTDPAVVTAIPDGTKLRSVVVKPDGIHLDLSAEFTSGAGSASLTGRLAQVLYTATSQQPDAKLWLSVEGKPLEMLGTGEGLMVEQPLTRKRFEQDFRL